MSGAWLWACLLASLVFSGARAQANVVPRLRGEGEDNEGIALAPCLVNTFAAVWYLQQAAMSVTASAIDCPLVDPLEYDLNMVCAADILGVFQSFENTAAYIANVVSTCDVVSNEDAECAASTLSFIGSLTELVQGLVSIIETCGKVKDPYSVNPEDVPNVTRRLQSRVRSAAARRPAPSAGAGARTDVGKSSIAPPAGEAQGPREALGDQLRRLGIADPLQKTLVDAADDNTEIVEDQSLSVAAGWCEVSVGSTLVYIAQAGVNIDQSVKDCSRIRSKEDSVACAADVTAVLASVSDVASYIGAASSLCAKTFRLSGMCDSDAGTIGNGLFGLESAAISFDYTCRRKRTTPTTSTAATTTTTEPTTTADGNASSTPTPLVRARGAAHQGWRRRAAGSVWEQSLGAVRDSTRFV